MLGKTQWGPLQLQGDDIDSSNEKIITGQHELDAIDRTTYEQIRESNKNDKLMNDIPK